MRVENSKQTVVFKQFRTNKIKNYCKLDCKWYYIAAQDYECKVVPTFDTKNKIQYDGCFIVTGMILEEIPNYLIPIIREQEYYNFDEIKEY